MPKNNEIGRIVARILLTAEYIRRTVAPDLFLQKGEAMTSHAFPFIEGEAFIHQMVARIVHQYADLGTQVVSAEVRKKLKLYAYNTTRGINVLCTKNGHKRVVVYFTATAPNGRVYESELELDTP